MSLLLDALKRAEEAKRAKQSGGATPPADTLPAQAAADAPRAASAAATAMDFEIEDYPEETVSRPPPRPAPMPAELALESIPEEMPAMRAPARETPAANFTPPAATVSAARLDEARADAAQSRDSARNVFGAKQAALQTDQSPKKWLLPVIAVVIVSVGAGGWYVWNEVNRVTRPASINLAARPANPAPLPPAQPGTGQPGSAQASTPKSGEPDKPAAPVEAALPPLLPPPAVEMPIPAAVRVAAAGPALTEREALAKKLKESPALPDTPVELRLARSVDKPVVGPQLAEAYAVLRSGDYARAGSLYARLIQADPLNIDAQLGMATVFARRGDNAAAIAHYRQVLQIDPRNGTALAGLLAVSDNRSPAREVELKTLLARSPDAATLHFSLGNLYAGERRWVEAQQAYFEAFRIESANADYVYNLAVSLDHLKQPRLAQDYYQKALALLPRAGGQFDAAAVARRLKELQDAAMVYPDSSSK